MKRILMGLWRRLVYGLSMPVILSEYFHPQTGRDYGVGFFTKLRLALKMVRNYRRILTGSRVVEHLLMATQILRVPKSVEGCVVECGSFKGGSATNLSLICAISGRRLEIFDSFAGLPEPSTVDKEHNVVSAGQVHTYEKGAWCGALDEVRGNIARHGNVEVCTFHKGYFNETLPSFKQPVIFAFVDVDLRDSLEPCLKYLWPLMQNRSYLFTHEAPHMEIASLFFSDQWWSSNLRSNPPGLVGAGSGLGLVPAPGGFTSALGYTVKNPAVQDFLVSPQTGVA